MTDEIEKHRPDAGQSVNEENEDGGYSLVFLEISLIWSSTGTLFFHLSVLWQFEMAKTPHSIMFTYALHTNLLILVTY